MSLLSPLGRVLGMGSAKESTVHWLAQRLTAVALVPLLLWFSASIAVMTGADYAAVRAWIANPVVSILLVFLAIAAFHHAQLGLQVVVEDYVHRESLKDAGIVVIKFSAVALAAVCIFSVLKIAVAG